jgi:hypothetical protein
MKRLGLPAVIAYNDRELYKFIYCKHGYWMTPFTISLQNKIPVLVSFEAAEGGSWEPERQRRTGMDSALFATWHLMTMTKLILSTALFWQDTTGENTKVLMTKTYASAP